MIFLHSDWSRFAVSEVMVTDHAVTIAFCSFFKMAARFAAVSGRSNGRGKCENLEKIAFRKRQKSYEMVCKKLKGKY